MTASIALFGATYFELKPLIKKLKPKKIASKKQAHLYVADFKGLPIYLVRTGVGKTAAKKGGELLFSHYQPTLCLSIGLCGAVNPNLKISEAVFPVEVMDYETGEKFNLKATSFSNGQKGAVVTVAKVFGPEDKKKLLTQNPEILACDMESSVLAEACMKQKTPFLVLRHVSDKADCQFLPEEILLEKNWRRQLKLLIQHSGWRFPVEMGRLILLGFQARRGVAANTKNILKLLLKFIDNRFH